MLLLPQEVDWVKFNVDMSGYYMVHYADGGWDAIVDLLRSNHTVLSGNDRASLIHDVFQLVGSVRPSGKKSPETPALLARVSRALLCSCCSVGKVRLDTALELSLYLSRETATMAVTQGFQELVPLYKLMEKRDMAALEDKMKVWTEAETDHTLWISLTAFLLLLLLLLCLFRATSWICSGT